MSACGVAVPGTPSRSRPTAGPPAGAGIRTVGDPGCDEERRTERNTVERAVNRLRRSRAVTVRYDERGHVLPGTVTVAAPVVRPRARSPGQVLAGAGSRLSISNLRCS
ncbi:hypothetical protein GCM10010405_50650 [Streptomyces macrosporus]|uniref:Uncharacterized protein n=1 Tax=Streptomyces macrosporus TaxID=44032 RepID=A0ABN3KL68_9ACTN